ncbi:hypothetical protein PHLGIDRAFT_427667 [Phlebiopsis gigantea 11061_1 CR5-6]|uniref:Uncharacterized protein n=1 Tax=Phlebiopsis gigantea (strain 11061_1 CR5-6) TaxID=745531 RepID=A0A0C3RYK8_PHLG1|nr:hypothetical protein PHLGIDRAFT_427667 [Phlebiopsis gigantea 11061_1 CR5-6]
MSSSSGSSILPTPLPPSSARDYYFLFSRDYWALCAVHTLSGRMLWSICGTLASSLCCLPGEITLEIIRSMAQHVPCASPQTPSTRRAFPKLHSPQNSSPSPVFSPPLASPCAPPRSDRHFSQAATPSAWPPPPCTLTSKRYVFPPLTPRQRATPPSSRRGPFRGPRDK